MRDYVFEDSIGYWICVTSHWYQRQLDKSLAPVGITFRQFQVLGWLVFEDNNGRELSLSELADRMAIEPPTLVRIIDRMESHRWVRRDSSEVDRRRKVVRLDQPAQPIWDQVVDCLTDVRRIATDGLTNAEVALLRKLLQKVQVNLASQGGESKKMPPPATEAAHQRDDHSHTVNTKPRPLPEQETI